MAMIELLLSLSVMAGPTSTVISPASSVSEQPQNEEVYRSAREYRIQVYRAFRNDRQEFNRRRSAASNVLRSWSAAGRNPRDSDEVVRWFEEALRRSEPTGIQSLPEPPALAGATSNKAIDPLVQQPTTTDTVDLDPPPVAGGFDYLEEPDDANAVTDDGPTFDVFSSTAGPGSSSRSGSPLMSLQRALWKAAASLSQDTPPQFDTLPDWPSKETQ